MQIPQDAMLLRIFIGESDRWQRQPLYEAVVLKAREAHLAGATVLRGPMGFGKSSRLHTAKILRLSMDLPIVIEIVDSEEKIRAFLPALDGMLGGGLVTLEKFKCPIRGRRSIQIGLREPMITNLGRNIAAGLSSLALAIILAACDSKLLIPNKRWLKTASDNN